MLLTFAQLLHEAMKEEVVIDYGGESDFSKDKKTAPDNPVKDGNAKKKSPAIKTSDKGKDDQNQDDENKNKNGDNTDDNKDDQNQDDEKDTKKDDDEKDKPKPKDDDKSDDSKGKDDDKDNKKVNEGLRTFDEFIKK